MSENKPNRNSGNMVVNFGRDISIRLDQPLNRFNNGGSQAYAAYDSNDRSRKLIAIVSGVENLPRWRDEKNYMALADPSFMRLLGSGILQWPIDNVQKYVFLYQADVGECLVKQGHFAKTAWRHPDIVKHFVLPMTRMLKEMEAKRFCHGAIRPDNIFYAGGDVNRPIILGDCLSSYTMSAQPALFMPVSKALTNEMGRGEGRTEDDIYAFGVSLALFLRRNDELAGLSDKDIVRKKIELGSYAAIIGAERFQASFLELLRGVLHDDAALRWTTEDIFAWLDGTRLTPAPLAKRKKVSRPLVFMNKKYYFADLLALDLPDSPDEVVDLVKQDVLEQWISKSLSDKAMHHGFLAILDRVGNLKENKDLLIAHLRMLLCNKLPIHYGEYCFHYDGLGGIMARAAHQDKDVSVFQDILSYSLPDYALVESPLPQNEVISHVKFFDKCRTELKKKNAGHGFEKALYLLCRHSPCLSKEYKGYFINSHKAALITFERLASQRAQGALFLDRHAIAFFSVLNPAAMEKSLYDLNSSDKDRQILGNLRFLSFMSRQAKDVPVNAIASVFGDSLSRVCKRFKNKSLRKQVEDAVKAAAAQGDLVTMISLLDDENTLNKDYNAFVKAMNRYVRLQKEYDYYNTNLVSKETYGATRGRDMAALVSWSIATAITLMVVIAFLSGYQIF